MAANEHEPKITIVKYGSSYSSDNTIDGNDYSNTAGEKITDDNTGTASYKFKSSDGSDAVQTGVETKSDIFYIWNNGENATGVHDLKEPKLSLTVTSIAGNTNLTGNSKINTVISWMKFKINNGNSQTLNSNGGEIEVQSLHQDKNNNTTNPRVLKAFSDTSDTTITGGADKKIKLQFLLTPEANADAGQYSYTLTISGKYT